MTDASTSGTMSPQLLKVAERAKREPEGRFHSLAHLIDVSALTRAYRRMRKDAAVGVDEVTKEQYGRDLERNLHDLHERLVSMRYRHQPSRDDVRTSGGRGARDGCTWEADGAFRADPSPGQDPPPALRATACKAEGRKGSGYLRLPRVYAALAAHPTGSVGDDVQDQACAPATCSAERRRLVSKPSTPAD
jgi:hypothetical protein